MQYRLLISVIVAVNFLYSAWINDDDSLTELNYRELFVSLVVGFWLAKYRFNLSNITSIFGALAAIALPSLVMYLLADPAGKILVAIGEENIIKDHRLIFSIATGTFIVGAIGMFQHIVGIGLFVIAMILVVQGKKIREEKKKE